MRFPQLTITSGCIFLQGPNPEELTGATTAYRCTHWVPPVPSPKKTLQDQSDKGHGKRNPSQRWCEISIESVLWTPPTCCRAHCCFPLWQQARRTKADVWEKRGRDVWDLCSQM
ncbi:hypothetical protein GN956_G7328 [Arapaima gigas]